MGATVVKFQRSDFWDPVGLGGLLRGKKFEVWGESERATCFLLGSAGYHTIHETFFAVVQLRPGVFCRCRPVGVSTGESNTRKHGHRQHTRLVRESRRS